MFWPRGVMLKAIISRKYTTTEHIKLLGGQYYL